MKLLPIFVASICAGTAAAQGINIGFPPVGENVSAGQQLTVQIIKNNHILSSTEAGLVIGFLPCTNVPGGCTGPEQLGSILYNGPYNPQVLEPGKSYENLTVTIPTGIPTGAAQIAIARFFLIGVGPSPSLGQSNVTVTVV